MNSSSNSSPNKRFRGSRKALDALSSFSNALVLKPSGFVPVDSLIKGRSTPEVLVKLGSPKVTVKASTPGVVKVVVSQQTACAARAPCASLIGGGQARSVGCATNNTTCG